MRLLFMVAAVILCQSNALAGQMQLTFSMLDIDLEVRQGTYHMVEVSLDGKSKLRMQDHSLIPNGNGEYTGVVRETLGDGTITVVLKLHPNGREYSGEYTIVSGSAAYAGARGRGSLMTLTGYEAAASATGVYRAQLEVALPDRRLSAVE